MDRTAWIAVALCVLGLVLWEVYVAKQMQPRPTTTAQAPPAPAASVSATPTTTASPTVSPSPAETASAFAEKIESLRNSDVELHLTNRGGGIKEVALLNQVAEKGQRVTLNARENIPIGAILDQPATPVLTEFTASRTADGLLQYEGATQEQITIRKKFGFAKSPEAKDNFVIDMDVDIQNGGTKPYKNSGYFVALGSAAPIHRKRLSFVHSTRLVHQADGPRAWTSGGSAPVAVFSVWVNIRPVHTTKKILQAQNGRR